MNKTMLHGSQGIISKPFYFDIVSFLSHFDDVSFFLSFDLSFKKKKENDLLHGNIKLSRYLLLKNLIIFYMNKHEKFLLLN